MTFWNVVAIFFWGYVIVSYLFALFAVVADIFRDHEMNGFAKAAWLLLLIFVPFIGVLVYLIAHGRSMGRRSAARAEHAQNDVDSYVRSVAGTTTSPSQEIAQAKALFEAGDITRAEYDSLKSTAVGGVKPTPVAV